MGGKPSSPEGKWVTSLVPLATCGKIPSQCLRRETLVRRWEPEDGEGNPCKDRRDGPGERSCGCRSLLHRSRRGFPLLPLYSASDRARKARAYMGRSPPPPARPWAQERRDRPAFPTPSHRHRSRRRGGRPRNDWPGLLVTSRGTVGSPRTKEMLIARQDSGKRTFYFWFPLRSSNFLGDEGLGEGWETTVKE